jgi:hypothetical protein
LKLRLVHINLLGSKKFLKNWSTRRYAAWKWILIGCSVQNRKRGFRTVAGSHLLNDRQRSLTLGFRYNPFTAADEKVPLSVVQVNNKPQYIVFSLRFLHHTSKHGHLPVESSKHP